MAIGHVRIEVSKIAATRSCDGVQANRDTIIAKGALLRWSSRQTRGLCSDIWRVLRLVRGGIAFARLSSSVILIEPMGAILPVYDDWLTHLWPSGSPTLALTSDGGTKAIGRTEDGCTLTIINEAGGKTMVVDTVLVTVGRVPFTEALALDELSLRMQGNLIEFDGGCRTSMLGGFVVGDVTTARC